MLIGRRGGEPRQRERGNGVAGSPASRLRFVKYTEQLSKSVVPATTPGEQIEAGWRGNVEPRLATSDRQMTLITTPRRPVTVGRRFDSGDGTSALQQRAPTEGDTMHFLAFIAETIFPPVAVIVSGILASYAGLPQSVHFEYSLVFEGFAAAAVVAAVVVTAVGFVSTLRDES